MRILFLSEKDLCRGPMARGVAERLARKADLDGVVFDSAGVTATPGEPPQLDAASFLSLERIDILRHRSKLLGERLADGTDLILAMTADIAARGRQIVGPDLAPKIVILNKGVELATKRLDIDPPTDGSVAALRRLYASLLAACGRLVRNLEEPGVCPEWFGARTVPRKFKVGAADHHARATAATIDPVTRQYLANLLFDFIERAFEPPTLSHLMDVAAEAGKAVGQAEIDEILRQDLHEYAQQDKQGCWVLKHDAVRRRRDKAKADARARQESHGHGHRRHEPSNEPKLTLEGAFEILGVARGTPEDEARRKYRALLKRYHPDKFHDDDAFRQLAEQKAKRINEAWDLAKSHLGPPSGNDTE
jgi:protein-tyrosine-phosphatase/DnaJ-domain-containing protein 1